MMKTFAIAAILVVGGAGAVLMAQSRQEQQMAAELRMLQEQQQQLALSMAQLAEALKAIHPRFDQTNDALRTRLADFEVTIKNMSGDVSAVRAQAQDSSTRLVRLGEEVDALHKSLAALQEQLLRMASMPSVVADPNAPPGAVSQAPAAVPLPGPASPSIVGTSPSKALETARGDYFSGQFAAAIRGFEFVVKNFPGTEAAAEAQLYIGESHFNEKRWPDAIAAYTVVIQGYPKSSFVPQAYYRRGIAQEAAGLFDEARQSFEVAAKTYAGTTAGQLAEQGLTRLNRPQPRAR